MLFISPSIQVDTGAASALLQVIVLEEAGSRFKLRFQSLSFLYYNVSLTYGTVLPSHFPSGSRKVIASDLFPFSPGLPALGQSKEVSRTGEGQDSDIPCTTSSKELEAERGFIGNR